MGGKIFLSFTCYLTNYNYLCTEIFHKIKLFKMITMACIISLIDPSKEKIVKTSTVDENYAGAEKRVKKLNKKLNEKPNKKGLFWVVTTIGV